MVLMASLLMGGTPAEVDINYSLQAAVEQGLRGKMPQVVFHLFPLVVYYIEGDVEKYHNLLVILDILVHVDRHCSLVDLHLDIPYY